jgi:predicted nucleic acid-binding protein
MILLDTSVWIRFLRYREPFAPKVRDLLLADRVTGHALVYGELFIGDIGGRSKLLADYERLPWTSTLPHEEVVAFARSRKLHGRGVSWIDVHLLASAFLADLPVWTADERFATIARELKIAYEPFPHKV